MVIADSTITIYHLHLLHSYHCILLEYLHFVTYGILGYLVLEPQLLQEE